MNKDLKSNGDLNWLQLFLCGGALFSMHFGASSMVWPMNWGKESGTSVLPAYAGAFITSLLLVFIAYVALARGDGSYDKITRRVLGDRFGKFYTRLTIAILGPFYAIPRMSAAAWDSVIQAFGLNPDNKIMLVIFTVVFYVITYFFLMNPGKAMDRISSILFPVLLVIVILIVGKGLLYPIATPLEKVYEGSAFAYGFTNGYATAEILCALIFGVVIFNTLKNKGVEESKMTRNMIKVGIVGIAMLSITHLAHMLIGASTGTVFKDLYYTSLYTAVAMRLFGTVGGMLFSGALFLAALTTAIGMTSGCAEFFVDTTEGKYNYKQCSIVILILSVIFGSLGLTSILGILGPILDGIYPAAIVLVLYYAITPSLMDKKRLNACRWAMYASFVFGMIDMVWKYLVKLNLNPGGIVDLYESIPLTKSSLAWMPVAIISFIIGWLTYKAKNIDSEVDAEMEKIDKKDSSYKKNKGTQI